MEIGSVFLELCLKKPSLVFCFVLFCFASLSINALTTFCQGLLFVESQLWTAQDLDQFGKE